MRDADLRAVVEESLRKRAHQPVTCIGTIVDLQLAMVEYPLIVGSAEELAWHMAETNALRQIRPDAPAAARARLLSVTCSRAVQELRGWNNPVSDLLPSALEGRRVSSGPTELLGKREGKAVISAELAGILERLGSSAERWWARLEKLTKGRLLGRYFAASRAPARSRREPGRPSPGQPRRLPRPMNNECRQPTQRSSHTQGHFRRGTRPLATAACPGALPSLPFWKRRSVLVGT